MKCPSDWANIIQVVPWTTLVSWCLVTDWDFVKRAASVDEALAQVLEDRRPLHVWLCDRIADEGLVKRSVIRRSRLNQTFAYQILSGERNPSRDKLIQLSFGLALAIGECSELLERGGHNALSPLSRRDVIIAYCLHNGLGLDECDDLLWDAGERTVVSAGL